MTEQVTDNQAANAVDSTVGAHPGSDENGRSDAVGQHFLPLKLDDLPGPLQTAAANADWTSLMPVQARALPYLFAGRDLMVQSRTGSGKTGAFLLPILDRIDVSKAVCQALVLVPTRELAQQVAKEAGMLIGDGNVRSTAIYGGVKYGPQLDALKKGAHLVIGTPGRILDHLMQRNLKLDDLRILVFDEADRMLSMGFYPDMREVQWYLPKRRVHSCMFSATFPATVMRLAQEFLTEPEFLGLSEDHVHVVDAEHVIYKVPAMKRDRSLVRLIEIENPASAIIFCNTKKMVHYVTVVLQRFGYDADELSSDLNQKAREQVLDRVRMGELRFLVATDVAARGIDIHELSHVFQYEPPEDPESYIHRAGRTARAGATGVAVSLVGDFSEQMAMERIAKRYGIDMDEREAPGEEAVTAVVSERVTTLLEAKLRGRDNLKTERMRRFIPLAREWTESEEGQALLAMLVDDFYQESLHGPQMPPPPAEAPRRGERAATAAETGDGSSSKRRRRRRSRRGRSNKGS